MVEWPSDDMIVLILLFSLPASHCLTLPRHNEDSQGIFRGEKIIPENNPNTDFEYNDLLSILHNDKSNSILLAKINNDDDITVYIAPPEYDNLMFVRNDDKDIDFRPKRSLEENLLKETHENTDVTRLKRMRANEMLDSNKISEEDSRSKRSSSIKLLKNLFVKSDASTTPSPATPLPLRDSESLATDSTFTDAITHLTSSIEKLNNNLNDIKVSVIENSLVLSGKPAARFTHVILRKNENSVSNETNNRPKREVNSDAETTSESLDNITRSANVTEQNLTPDVKEKQEIEASRTETTEASTSSLLEITTELNTESTTHEELDLSQKVNSTAARSIKSEVTPDDANDNVTDEKISNQSEHHNITNADEEDPPSKPIARTTLDQRENLVEYIEHLFQEIQNKVKPIKFIKASLSSDRMYKIGYIVATIDAVDMTINKLNKKLEANKEIWGIKKLQQVLRKLDLSSSLLDDVLENLNLFVSK